MAAAEVAVPATATAASPRSRTSAGTAARMPASTLAASAASSSAVGGSECRWRSVWRTTPIWADVKKSILPADPQTSSVEPPPMSITTRSTGSSGGRAAVAPANVNAASCSPVRVFASRPKRSRTTAANSAPLAASRTAEVITAALASQRCSRIWAAYRSRVANTRRCGSSPSRPVASTPSPRRVTVDSRTRSSIAEPSTPAISSRVELVPMSTTATRTAASDAIGCADHALPPRRDAGRRLHTAGPLRARRRRAHAALPQARRHRSGRPGRDVQDAIQRQGPDLRARLQVAAQECRRGDLRQGVDRQGAQEDEHARRLPGEVLRLPGVLAQQPRDVLLAGTPDLVRERDRRLPHRGSRREVQGRVTPRPARVGCSGWNYADWRGRVYPDGLPPSRWLAHYATRFDTVEVNSTFY